MRAKQGTAFEAHVNGAVEKRNHSVGLRLAMMAEAEGDKHAWDELLPFVQHSINHQVYSHTSSVRVTTESSWRRRGRRRCARTSLFRCECG